MDEFEAMSSDYQADDPNFVSRYDQLLNLLQYYDAFNLQEVVQAVLKHLGVGREIDAKVSTLSGGQIMSLLWQEF